MSLINIRIQIHILPIYEQMNPKTAIVFDLELLNPYIHTGCLVILSYQTGNNFQGHPLQGI